MSYENEEETDEKRRREGKKEENGTGTDKRMRGGFVPAEAFLFLAKGGELESCGDLSWEDLLDKPEDLSDRVSEAWVVVLVVLDVTDVLVSLLLWSLSFCDGFSCCSDWEFVEPQPPECERLSDHCKDAAVPGRN